MARERVIFFGSGPVASASLKLLREHCDIEAIITKSTTKSMMETACPGATTYTVATKQELENLIEEKKFTSRLGVLIDFGIIVSQKTIDYFPKGIINSHFSLLPQWRGADPISFSLLSGQKETGVSLMLLSAGMDEGMILSSGSIDISSQTGPELTSQLIDLSDGLLRESIPLYSADQIIPISQEANAGLHNIDPVPTYSRKLSKDDGVIDWIKPADQIEREIRAFIEWPKSRTQLAGKDVIITKAHVIQAGNNSLKPGDVQVNVNTLSIKCGSGSLSIDSLKPAGKKEMPIQAFLLGYKL